MPPWAIITAATLAATAFSFLEWRRANPHHLALRLLATVLAVIALPLLGLRPTWQPTFPSSSGNVSAALWTPLAAHPAAPLPPVPAGIAARHRFALPAAASLDPAATVVPDAAFLRRHFPEIGALRLLGDGLDPSELDALRGLHVAFTPPASAPAAPGIRFLHCPRELDLGDPLIVQGSLDGLPPNTSITLTLEAPDGTITTTTPPADASGETRFALRTAPLPSAGRFLWRLRAPAAAGRPPVDLPLGVAVTLPTLPRLLVLESAPRFDTAALRRWFEAAGGTLAARTQLGRDRYQYTASQTSPSPPPSFTALDAPLLAGVDLVLADSRALLALPPVERDALLAAVTDTGLGLLVLPDDTLPPSTATPFFPWQLSPLVPDTQGGDRPARLQWPGQTAATDLPLPTAPFEIILPSNTRQRPLLGDRQGHTLAATDARGRGQLALTLVRDTTRWQRENDPAAFAAYWSFLFSRLARPADAAAAARWSLPDGDAGPVFVDHPLELCWSGPVDSTPGPATVSATAATDPATLALARDPVEPGRWRGTFWPRRAGWHRVSLASGEPALDFYVTTADAWPALDTARRQAATARFAETSTSTASTPTPPPTREEFPPVWLAALFFVSTAYLWIERRFTR